MVRITFVYVIAFFHNSPSPEKLKNKGGPREATKMKEFVMLYEQNYDKEELFIFYLQWTGNEEALSKLYNIIQNSHYDEITNESAIITMDIENKIPESAVDIHCKSRGPNKYNTLFTKCSGKFIYPFDDDELNEFENAYIIESTFCNCEIRKFFN